MKCPKCKKEMTTRTEGNMVRQNNGFFYCQNKKCEFFGIQRIDFELYDA